MIFNDNESLSNLYSNISKQVEPSKEQLTRQAPLLSNTSISKDQESLQEAYEKMSKEPPCPCTIGKKCTKKDCDCGTCKKALKESKYVKESPIQEAKKKDKPDYMDADEDGDKKESMKKALKDKAMKESSNFKKLFSSVMTESAYSGPFEIAKKVWKLGRIVTDQRAPYVVTMKDGKESPLKGESILNLLKNEKSDWVHNVKSIRPAYPEGSNKESAYDTVDDI